MFVCLSYAFIMMFCMFWCVSYVVLMYFWICLWSSYDFLYCLTMFCMLVRCSFDVLHALMIFWFVSVRSFACLMISFWFEKYYKVLMFLNCLMMVLWLSDLSNDFKNVIMIFFWWSACSYDLPPDSSICYYAVLMMCRHFIMLFLMVVFCIVLWFSYCFQHVHVFFDFSCVCLFWIVLLF